MKLTVSLNSGIISTCLRSDHVAERLSYLWTDPDVYPCSQVLNVLSLMSEKVKKK